MTPADATELHREILARCADIARAVERLAASRLDQDAMFSAITAALRELRVVAQAVRLSAPPDDVPTIRASRRLRRRVPDEIDGDPFLTLPGE